MSNRSLGLWLAGYAATMALVVFSVLEVRRRTLSELDTHEGRAQWQTWREGPENQPDSGPVSRRPPKTEEPPAVVLLRDHFPVMLGAGLAFGSLLFAVLTSAIYGSTRGTKRSEDG